VSSPGRPTSKALIDVGQAITNLKSLVDYFVQKSPIRDAHVFMDAYSKGEVLPIPLIPQWQGLQQDLQRRI